MKIARIPIVWIWLPAMIAVVLAVGRWAGGDEWSQWGRDQSRNMATDPSSDVPLPTTFDLRSAIYGKKDGSLQMFRRADTG